MLSEGTTTGKIADYGLRLLDSGKMMCFVTFDINGELSSWSCGTESQEQQKFLVNILKGMGWRHDAEFNSLSEIADGTAGKCLDESRTFGLELKKTMSRGGKEYVNVDKIKTGMSGRMSSDAVKEKLAAGAVAGKPVEPSDIPF